MTSRSIRYFRGKKFQRFLFKALAKNVQEAIDEEIVKTLIRIAKGEEESPLKTI